MGRLVEVADTRLYVEERGEPSAFPLLVFHGGPGLDHTWFGDYLDPLTEGAATGWCWPMSGHAAAQTGRHRTKRGHSSGWPRMSVIWRPA